MPRGPARAIRVLFLSVLVVFGAARSHTQVRIETARTSAVYTVTARDIENLPLCGRTFTNLATLPTTPALQVTESKLNLSPEQQSSFTLDGVQLETGDGQMQSGAAPFCVPGRQVLEQPIKIHYGNSVIGEINIHPEPRPAGSRPFVPAGAGTSFFTTPLYQAGQAQTIWGPFGNPGNDTRVEVNNTPGLILSRTATELYWMLPPDTPRGPLSVSVYNAGQGARFSPFLLGLSMSAQKLALLKGESTGMQATVFGPELLPKQDWVAGNASDVVDMSLVAQQFPGYQIPKPGEPGKLFFRLDNASRDTVTLSPSKNESFVTMLDQGNFSAGPYTYTGTIHSIKAGNFGINGLVVAFFAPIAGVPVQPPVVAQPPAEAPTAPTETPKGPAQPPVTVSPGSPCPKKGDDCAELRRIAEQLEAVAAAARASAPGASDQQFKLNEAAAIANAAADSLAFAAKLKAQAQAYRDLAQSARDAAKKDRARAADNPPGSQMRAFWEQEAVIDDQRADDYEKQALRLEADAAIEEARAKAEQKQAGALRQGIDPAKVSDLEAKVKAAADARAAYNDCVRKANADCPVQPGKYSLSLGLTYKWDKPMIGPNWPPLPPGGRGGGIRIRTTDQPPPGLVPPTPPTPATTQRPEEPCAYQLTDGWLEPTQGVWQDDPKFEDRPGKQLTRLNIPGVISYLAELPMVKDRDTVIMGVHHYELNGAPVMLNKRNYVVMKGLSNCPGFDPVDVNVSVQGPAGKAAFKIASGQIPMHGKPLDQMVPWEVSALTFTGLPESHTFKFDATGPYTIVAEIATSTGGTGMQMRVSGNVVETHGPMVHFIPVVLQAGGPDNILNFTTRKLASDSATYLPDLLPLRPGGLPTQKDALKDFSKDNIPGVWFDYRKENKLLALVQDHLGVSAFLTGAGRVVAVLNLADFRMLQGTGIAGTAPEGTFTIAETGATLSHKVILIPRSSEIVVVGHELTHTLPGLWSSDEMMAECGINYHNKDMSLANGLRLVVGGVPSGRKDKDGSTPMMGPRYGEDDEDLTHPLTGEATSIRMVKNPETGQMESQFIFQRWITQCTYRHLANVLQTPPDPPMLLVRGYVGRRDGKYTASLSAFYDLMGSEDLPQDYIGDFAIVLKDASGKQLATYKFAPDWTLPGTALTRDLTAFAFRVPKIDGLAQIELTGPAGVLASKTLSANPPKIEILAPSDGSSVTPQGGRVSVNWRGSGDAGKALVYTVLYSDDGGTRWDERVFEQAATLARIVTSTESKQHAIKVIASDGTRSAEATVHFTTR